MANAYINVYTGNVVAGGTGGSPVSLDGAQTNPITASLDGTTNESKIVKCALRCSTGYKTTGNVTMAFTGDTAAKWGIAADNGYADETAASAATFVDTLTISDTVDATNKIFWLKVSSDSTEDPKNDTSVSLKVTATVETAS